VTREFELDMTMMYVVHDALRRDLAQVAQMTVRTDGWDLFESFLRVHHEAEDDALWPVMQEALIGDDESVALLDEMRAEHAALDPLLAAIDEAFDRGDEPVARAELATRLREHLAHEEEAALPLIDRTLAEEQWMQYGQLALEKFRPDLPTFVPWLLHSAEGERARGVLGRFPDQAQQTCRDEWQPAYAAKSWWTP
jgi:Hemerythrin HHE cation binding domain